MNQLATLALSFLFLSSAHAVSVSKCPQQLEISYGWSKVFDNTTITKNAEDSLQDPSEVLQVSAAFSKMQVNELRQVLKLTSTKNSTCEYLSMPTQAAPSGVETRLMTRNGKNWLRVAIPLAPEVSISSQIESVWVYHEVTSYDLSGVQVKAARGYGVLGYFDHGSPRVTIGLVGEPIIK